MLTDQMIENGISEKLFYLLHRWMETRLRKMIKSPFLPTECQRFVFLKSYNKNNQAMFTVKIFEGLDYLPSTSPREFTDADEMGFVFYKLDSQDQILILSWLDPFDEFKNSLEWRDYLKSFDIKGNHSNLLVDAMGRLQYMARERGLIKMPIPGEIRGWGSIATFLGVSIPTAIKLCTNYKAPVGMIGGEIVTTENKLTSWMERTIDDNLYWKLKEEKNKMRRKG
jgi:hypothetical protein